MSEIRYGKLSMHTAHRQRHLSVCVCVCSYIRVGMYLKCVLLNFPRKFSHSNSTATSSSSIEHKDIDVALEFCIFHQQKRTNHRTYVRMNDQRQQQQKTQGNRKNKKKKKESNEIGENF